MNLNPLYRGDTREYALTFTDSNGDPINIDGWTIYFTLKKNERDTDDEAALKKDTTEHEPEVGKTKFTLTPSNTNDLKPAKYFYDIQVKKKDGDKDVIVTVVKGNLEILTDITRRTT